MFVKKQKLAVLVPTVFGREIRFEGDLVCSRALAIRGSFSGSIDSTGDLLTEKGSALSLDLLRIRSLVVKGELDAKTIRAQRVELHTTARLSGEVFTASFKVAGGARISARLDMESSRLNRVGPESESADPIS